MSDTFEEEHNIIPSSLFESKDQQQMLNETQKKLSPLEARLIRGSIVIELIEACGFDKLPNASQILLTRFDFNYQKPPVRYPYEQYLKMLYYFRETLYGQQDVDEAYEAIGYKISQDYLETPIGRMLIVAAKFAGVQRSAKQFALNMKYIFPWGSHEMEEVTANYARYHINFVPGPAGVMRGMLYATLKAVGAKTVRINSRTLGEEERIHEIYWS